MRLRLRDRAANQACGDAGKARAPLPKQAAWRAALLYSLYTGPVGQLRKKAREARAMLAQDLHAGSSHGNTSLGRAALHLVPFGARGGVGTAALSVALCHAGAQGEVNQDAVGP